MPLILVVSAIAATAAVHFLRPDISIAVTRLISQKYHQFMPTVHFNGLPMVRNFLQHLSSHLQLGVGKYASLPWMEYYSKALGFMEDLIEGLVYWAAFVEAAFTHTGYPELGPWARIGIYIGASVLMIILLRMVWAVVAGLLSIIGTVLVWVFYPLRLFFGLFRRLFFGRNGRTPVGSAPSAVGHGAPGHVHAAGAGGH